MNMKNTARKALKVLASLL